MISHTWSSYIDWQYCQLENCKIVGDNITLSSDMSGTILSDIRDSSNRINNYAEVIPKLDVPLSTAALVYIRSGWNDEYHTDSWTDWKLINEPEQRMEYTLSLTKNRIIVDYAIKSIVNIYCINNTKYQALAMNMDTVYLTPLTDADADNELYSYLWSGLIDEAIVDFAKVDQDGEPLTTYAENATFVDNVITLKNPLPDENVIVIVRYIPRHFIYSDANCRYIQFKIELLSMEYIFFQTHDKYDFSTKDNFALSLGTLNPISYFKTHDKLDFMTKDGFYIDVSSINPTVSSMTINYKLDVQKELEDIFPKFLGDYNA